MLALVRPPGRRIQEGESVMGGKDDSINSHDDAVRAGSPADTTGIELSEASDAGGEGVSRREMLKIAAGAVIAVPLVGSELKAKAASADLTAGGKAPLF